MNGLKTFCYIKKLKHVISLLPLIISLVLRVANIIVKILVYKTNCSLTFCVDTYKKSREENSPEYPVSRKLESCKYYPMHPTYESNTVWNDLAADDLEALEILLQQQI